MNESVLRRTGRMPQDTFCANKPKDWHAYFQSICTNTSKGGQAFRQSVYAPGDKDG